MSLGSRILSLLLLKMSLSFLGKKSIWPLNRLRSFRETESPPTRTIHKNGDLTLYVGAEHRNKETIFVVSSAAFRQASPIWATALPANKRGRKALRFTRDNPEAFYIILTIAHLRFIDLPNVLSLEELVELAAVCHSYDTVPLVRPFLQEWLRMYRGRALRPGHEQWLTVAYTFGMRDDYVNLAQFLTLHCTTTIDEQLVNSEGTVLNNGTFPAEIFDRIHYVRNWLLREFTRRTYALVDRMIEHNICIHAPPSDAGNDDLEITLVPQFATQSATTARPRQPSLLDENTRCTYLMHASLVRELKHLRLIPRVDDVRKIKRSVHDLSEGLMNIEWKVLTWIDHGRCNVGSLLRQEIQTALNEMPAVVPDEHLEHIRAQSLK